MASIRLQGSITLPDGSTTGPFSINIRLLPTTVAQHVVPIAGAPLPGTEIEEPTPPPAAADGES